MPRLFLSLSLLTVLLACGPSAGPAAAPPPAGGATDTRGSAAAANSYLPREGEPLTSVKVGSCVVSGSNIHLNTALRANLFPKYGLDVQHVFISGAAISMGALANNDIQFLYCGPEGTLPGLAAGNPGKIVAVTQLDLGYMLLTRAEVKSVADLKGRAVGVARVGSLPDRLLRAVFERHGLVPNEDVTIRALGGSTPERHRAMLADVIQGHLAGPPYDVATRKEGHNVVYHISDLGLPSIGMAMHASNGLLRDNPQLVQRFVAAMAEAIRFTQQNPSLAREALQNTLEMEDPEALDSVYDAYAIKNVNPSLIVPFDALAAGLEDVRAAGTPVAVDGPDDIATNAFAEDLQRTGFLDQLWGGKLREP